ncbi:MAG: DUF1599 domain-containing protein [Muribaculaceae bacterium]|nr:DUF1599 domain-containing protein [Muribaculaceae bacterium]
MPKDTPSLFDIVLTKARQIFVEKGGDYGPTWRIMRPRTMTDQMFIKARRIRNIEDGTIPQVNDEDITSDFYALVNYGIMAIIQLETPSDGSIDITTDKALELYDQVAQRTKDLMTAKNHDYDEAWRYMRVSSFTDIILTKLQRIKNMEDRNTPNKVSEGPASNYQDIINYSIFAIIHLSSLI